MESVSRGEASADEAYLQALQRLFLARRAGIDFGLERTRGCLARLSLERPRIAVQVAGTNGKGSSAHMLASVLRAAGYRVGVFSSPHLMSLRERFRIDEEPASKEAVVRAEAAVSKAAADGGDELSFFESVTCMAVWLFAQAQVEVAIYEVGLGGRLDSTTAIPCELSVVTGIGMDHCEYLGNSLEEIAREKAGIFRAGVPALVGLSAPASIRELLLTCAREVGAPAHSVSPSLPLPVTLAMAGPHQSDNARLVLACIPLLEELGLSIGAQATAIGLSRARLRGRLEQIDERSWIDGAHNAQAARALASALEGTSWTLVVGLSREKDAAAFLAPLLPHCAALVCTRAANDRALEPEKIAASARELGCARVHLASTPAEALSLALGLDKHRQVLVTGSLLMVGELMAALGNGPVDPLLVTDPGSGKFATSR